LKYLLLALGLFVVYCLWKAYKRKARRASPPPASVTAEDMVRCAQCGVHLPRGESLPSGELFYCTPEHRRLHRGADPRS
jgi:uncharacterized protein